MPAALRSSLRARSMNARYWAWNTTPPASVSWKYTRTGIRNGLFNGRTADRAPPPARRCRSGGSGERGDAPAQRPLQVALLDEEGLEHVLDGFGVLADGMREVVE